MEEPFSTERLLDLNIGAVVQIISMLNGLQYTVNLIGIDPGNSFIVTAPTDGQKKHPELFAPNSSFEIQAIHEGNIIAFEASIRTVFEDDLLICTFPQVVQSRRFRKELRFPCSLSCDIHYKGQGAYGAIINISNGGCQINIQKDGELRLFGTAKTVQEPVSLDVFLPPSERAVTVTAQVKSISQQHDGLYAIGISFCGHHECIRRYLDSLHLDSISPFIS